MRSAPGSKTIAALNRRSGCWNGGSVVVVSPDAVLVTDVSPDPAVVSVTAAGSGSPPAHTMSRKTTDPRMAAPTSHIHGGRGSSSGITGSESSR